MNTEITKSEVLDSLMLATTNDKNMDLVGFEFTLSNGFDIFDTIDTLTIWWFVEGSREITLVCELELETIDFHEGQEEVSIENLIIKECVISETPTSLTTNLEIEEILFSELAPAFKVFFDKRNKINENNNLETLVQINIRDLE